MRTACFIPVKANSERVPGKNFRIICGKPLYTYIIMHVLEAKIFDDIYVEKLTIDTNLTDHAIKNIIIKDKDIERKLSKYFSYYDVINIKSLVFDIMHKGYYE